MGERQRLGDVVDVYVAAQIAVILGNEDRLRDGDLGAVHPTRVAVRRLRSTLRSFDVYKRPAVAELHSELRWYARLLGRLRDTDVVARRLERALADVDDRDSAHAAAIALQKLVSERSAAAWVELGTVLGGKRYKNLRRTLTAWRTEPPLTKRADGPASEVADHVGVARREMADKLERAERAAADGAADAIERAHSARRAGKRYRYAAEVAVAVVGDEAIAIAKKGRKLQNALGEQQDAGTALAFLEDLSAAADPVAAPALDELRRREEAIVADADRVLAAARAEAGA
ncbi:CHAD domain-containing protein [Gordonia sp. (in: high G+C Gram-positive bacteria)]|uniref:CHAD domain-containing protein n=1 Tax=Gordonia sp. (in: high G+C Gram-positive bacteria) TaxID=84139 RepID=UPI0039E42A01